MYNYVDKYNYNFDADFYELNYKTLGIEVKILKPVSLIIETLERVGVINHKLKIITPSCYLNTNNNKFLICHFKELLANDGFKNLTHEIDYLRRNKIATMLENWGHVEILDRKFVLNDLDELKIAVLKFSNKNEYSINHKYMSYDSI